ncbi:beta-carotene 15,15'-monooxygenase [Chryseobacterium sp.]|uniref:beta-carotene 15,15'-monooxygenase n=1 Tax=Chryseobacterium sp. TaxID=1871047 RepID=UPI0011C7815F|nr:beta-carotene 15,15'-monooxygenase [Chryseobacterium sp.]TXF77487.1 beta-carotene 15,15'-monooxygenase [Chryseobacterium sp.]
MPEFDLDTFKKTWQEQEVQPKYDSAEIRAMLNKSSRNYVKYIFWISAAEFLVILSLTVYYTFLGNDSKSLLSILSKLGVKNSSALEYDVSHFYIILKSISIVMTAFFVVKFYRNYAKIKVESNLKKFILQIIDFKKTVNLFILANIALLVIFTGVLTGFIFYVLSEQQIHLSNSALAGFFIGLAFITGLSILLIWLYYRIVYGIIVRRLGKNLEELKKIDSVE